MEMGFWIIDLSYWLFGYWESSMGVWILIVGTW